MVTPLRPNAWTGRDTALLATVLAVGLLTRLAIAYRAPLFVVNDSLSYVQPAWTLIHGLGFEPLFKRPPLYPLFAALTLWLFGEDPQVIAVAQHALGLALVGLTFVLGRLVGGQIAATVAGLLTAISGALLGIEHYLMSETLFGLLLTGAVVAFLALDRRPSLRLAALTGALLGLATLTRPIGQLVLPLFVVWLLWRHWPRFRSGLSVTGTLLVAYLLIVVPWMTRNLLVQHSFTVAGGMGEGLAVRTIRYEQRFDFRSPNGSAEPEPLRSARRIYRDEAGDGSAFELAARLRNELNVTPAQADSLMRQIALEAILRQPVYFLTGTVDMFWDMLTGRSTRLRQDWLPWRGMVWDQRIAHLLPRATPLQDAEFPRAELVLSIYDPARLWPLILGIAALGAALRPSVAPRRWPALLAIIVLSQLLVAAALVGLEWRYRFPLDPLINALVGAGAAAVAERLRHAPASQGRGFPAQAPSSLASPRGRGD